MLVCAVRLLFINGFLTCSITTSRTDLQSINQSTPITISITTQSTSITSSSEQRDKSAKQFGAPKPPALEEVSRGEMERLKVIVAALRDREELMDLKREAVEGDDTDPRRAAYLSSKARNKLALQSEMRAGIYSEFNDMEQEIYRIEQAIAAVQHRVELSVLKRSGVTEKADRSAQVAETTVVLMGESAELEDLKQEAVRRGVDVKVVLGERMRAGDERKVVEGGKTGGEGSSAT